MGSQTMRAGVDAWTESNGAGKNHGESKFLVVRNDGTIQNYSFIYFKNPAPRGATVTSATLRLYGQGTWGSKSIRARPVSAHWVDSQVTWNSQPDVLATFSSTVTQANTDALEWAFDVTTLIQAMCDGTANYGFRIAATVTDANIAKFYSLDAGDNQPVLDVAWSDAPDTPHTLSPSGGRAVNVSKPILRFDYTDVSGSTALANVQVQINPTNSFAAPAFDSGTVSTTVPQLDLSTTAYAGISAGAVAWWRVRVQDSAGLWSGWSDPSQFTRTAQGALTVTNPPVSGATVTDVTPPIIWSLSGATQKQWRVQVALASRPWNLLYDTLPRDGTATSFTLPKGIIDDQTLTYRLWVRVRDTVDRESTSGDPIWLTVIRDFTFAESATVPPVTSLAAAQVTDRPWVRLTWSRSTAPDSFTVTRDGRTVDSGLLPADLTTGGTNYAYVDHHVAPFISHTYKVQANVNGVHSSSNPTITFSYSLADVWLIDPDQNDFACPVVIDDGVSDAISWDQPETAGIYNPVGSKKAIRIVQRGSKQGPTGSVHGRITDYASQSATFWTGHMETFADQPTNKLRLRIGEYSLNVIIGNVVIKPIESPDPDDRDVTFSFWTQDGPWP